MRATGGITGVTYHDLDAFAVVVTRSPRDNLMAGCLEFGGYFFQHPSYGRMYSYDPVVLEQPDD
jgi:hypothetical protein